MNSHRMWRSRGHASRSLALTAILLTTTIAACFPSEGPTGVIVKNDLDTAVRMTYVVEGKETSLSGEAHGDSIAPGQTTEFTLDLFASDNKEVCTRGDLVARSEAGVELARIPPPVCAGGIPLLSSWAVPPAS